jgi:predicted alpha/beta hydrolase family esterase
MAASPAEHGEVPRRFLILHGWQNRRPIGHWEWWLAERLRERGHEVCYPQLPEPDHPELKAWLGVIETAFDRRPGVEQVVVAHSLACAAWIRLAESGEGRLLADRLLFVAPPSPKYLAETPELREFQFAEGAHQVVPETSEVVPRLVCSDNDPYCDPPADVIYEKTFDVDFIPGAGHLDMVAGYGRWRSLLHWCEDPEARIMAD